MCSLCMLQVLDYLIRFYHSSVNTSEHLQMRHCSYGCLFKLDIQLNNVVQHHTVYIMQNFHQNIEDSNCVMMVYLEGQVVPVYAYGTSHIDSINNLLKYLLCPESEFHNPACIDTDRETIRNTRTHAVDLQGK